MKFYDKVQVTLQSGKGGDGIVSARREAKVPYGGPAGGNGWKWGAVILRWSKDVNTLIDFRYSKIFGAPKGEPGRTKEQYGKNAEDLILKVPVGTVVREVETGHVLHQFLADGDEYVACAGWQGGIGNMHFKNASNQYPQFALLGEPGETRQVELELQLLGDVALIGTPSVGKSSLINAVSNVKAKVADYPFTTLIPNLGSVKHRDFSFNLVDVPGLIEWASGGKWLGNEFLRHILKASVFAFVIDASRYEQGMEEFGKLFDEVLHYMHAKFMQSRDFGGEISAIDFQLSKEKKNLLLQVNAVINGEQRVLMKKMIMIVLNKSDLLEDSEIISEYRTTFARHAQHYLQDKFGISLDSSEIEIVLTSAVTREGVDGRLDMLQHYIQYEREHVSMLLFDVVPVAPKPQWHIREVTEAVMPWLIEKWYLQELDAKYSKVREVADAEFCRLAYMLPWGNDEAELRFWNVMSKKRFVQKLESAGLVKGDIIKVTSLYDGVEDKYIRY